MLVKTNVVSEVIHASLKRYGTNGTDFLSGSENSQSIFMGSGAQRLWDCTVNNIAFPNYGYLPTSQTAPII